MSKIFTTELTFSARVKDVWRTLTNRSGYHT
jgi:hypothetical protein